MTVCKFGGSSLADAFQMKKVKSILESNKKRTVAIVSAPGKRNSTDEKITDLLYECNALAQQNRSCRPVFEKISARFIQIAKDLKLDADAVTQELDEIRQGIDAGKGTDYAASRGEYLSARIMARFLGWEFVDAGECIVINSDGTVNPLSYERLSARLIPGGHYVIPGFYGSTAQGVIKTFSRGGSDISGAIAARATDADLYENWTDVSGMYSAHEEAIAPVIEKRIPINIRNTNDPQADGTMIIADNECSGLIGVSGKTGYSKLTLRKLMMFKRPGMRHALLTMLHLYGVRPSYSLFGIDSIVWFFESRQANDSVLKAMMERLKKDFDLDEISVERDHAIVGLVGGNMNESTAFIDASVALKNEGIRINCLNYGASDTTVLIGVNDSDCKRAVEVIYKALFA